MWNVKPLHYYPTLERRLNLPLTHQATITHQQLSVLSCECNLCISIIRWHSRNHNQAKTRTTVETTDYPSPKPQPNKPQNHRRIKTGITAEPTPKPQLNQSYNRSQNYSQTNPTNAAEITLPLPEWVSEITMRQPSVQQAQHTYNGKSQVNRNKQHIKHTAEIHSQTNQPKPRQSEP